MARMPCGTLNESYQKDMAIIRTPLQWALLIAFVTLLFVLPLFSSDYTLSLTNRICIAIISVIGLNILTGYTGLISLGQAGFMAVGAYISTLLSIKLGFPFWLCIPCAGLGTALVGAVFGLPALRLKEFYLLFATVAAQLIIIYVLMHSPAELTGAASGLSVPRPRLGDFILNTETRLYYPILICTIIAIVSAKNLIRTRVGRAFIAIRDNDIAGEMMGVNLFRYKVLAFSISSVYAGVAGSLWAYHISYIAPSYFTLMDSIWYLGMIIIGGLGSILGCVLGATFVELLTELTLKLSGTIPWDVVMAMPGLALSLGMIVFGLVLVLFIIFEPRGLAHRWELFKSSYRQWPFSY